MDLDREELLNSALPYGPVWTLFSDRQTNQQTFIPQLVVLLVTSLVFRWIQEREATKRALGLPPYGPVWTLVRTDGKQGPISIGKTPLVIGADVSRMEKVIPVQMDYPTVSHSVCLDNELESQ